MYDINLSKKAQIITVILITLAALLIRLIHFDKIYFTYDQARDALEAIAIFESDPVKIIGPRTDIPGLNHGPLYWYILAPFYFFSQGNVYVAKFFLMLLNLAVIPLLFYVARKMFKNTFIAISASILYAVSFSMVQYSAWISNPAPAMFSLLVTMYSFWLITQKDVKGIMLFIISWPISVHFQFFFTYQLLFFIGLLFFFPPPFKQLLKERRSLIISGVVSLLLLSSFILSELKFNFLGITSLFHDIGNAHGYRKSIVDIGKIVLDKYGLDSFYLLGGSNLGANIVILMVFCLSLFTVFKERSKSPLFIPVLWYLMPLTLFSFEKQSAIFVLQSATFGIILCFSYWLSKAVSLSRFKRSTWLVILGIIAILNVQMTVKYASQGQVIFAIQEGMLISEQYKIIDYIYSEANSEAFAINTVTNPLFNNTTWAFFLKTYGAVKYGYMPVWLGYPQVDPYVYGQDIVYSDTQVNKGDLYFVIYEPPEGIPMHYYNGYPVYEDSRSTLIERKEFGTFSVEKRILTGENTNFSRDELVRYIKQ